MHYLSFDCATKSFAYSLSYVDLNDIHTKYNHFIDQALKDKDPIKYITYLDEFKHSIINLIDGEVIDFFPNIPDTKIDTVERIQKISNYVKNTIIPKIEHINIEIFIEFQMGSNHKARMISSALIAIFSEYKVRLINPSLKNQVYTSEEGKHKHFIKKYSNLYSANKEHARYNFCIIENIFGSNIPYTKKSDRGHIADSFMQVLGFLLQKK
jgi:hypothetical protein